MLLTGDLLLNATAVHVVPDSEKNGCRQPIARGQTGKVGSSASAAGSLSIISRAAFLQGACGVATYVKLQTCTLHWYLGTFSGLKSSQRPPGEAAVI